MYKKPCCCYGASNFAPQVVYLILVVSILWANSRYIITAGNRWIEPALLDRPKTLWCSSLIKWLCTYKNVIDTDVERLQSGNTVLPLSVSEADGLSWADQSNVQPSTSVLLPCYINHSCIYRFSFSIETGSMYQPYASHFFRFLANS